MPFDSLMSEADIALIDKVQEDRLEREVKDALYAIYLKERRDAEQRVAQENTKRESSTKQEESARM
jgi:exoribonuclease II